MDNELCAKKDPRSIRPLATEINSLKVANELHISEKMLPGAKIVVHIGCKFVSKTQESCAGATIWRCSTLPKPFAIVL